MYERGETPLTVKELRGMVYTRMLEYLLGSPEARCVNLNERVSGLLDALAILDGALVDSTDSSTLSRLDLNRLGDTYYQNQLKQEFMVHVINSGVIPNVGGNI